MYKNFFDGYDVIAFDLNGTVILDEFAWETALNNVFSNEIISENPYYGERGQDIRSKISAIKKLNTLRSSVSEDSYYEIIVNEFFNHIDDVEVTPGFFEFADFLKSKGKKLALVTNSDSRITNGILEKKGLKKYFDLIITSDDVSLPKPAPDIYLYLLEKLNVKKDKVLVFEDSISGALSAENADLKMIILLPDEFNPSDYGSKNRNFIKDFETIMEEIEQDADSYITDFFNN